MADAFLTGSHAYGEPRNGSDVDLVVLVSEQTMAILSQLADLRMSIDGDYGTENRTVSLRFGDLNLLCCMTPEVQDIWRRGTRYLKDQRRRLGRPITRDEAIEYFHILRERAAGRAVPDMKWGKEASKQQPHKKEMRDRGHQKEAARLADLVRARPTDYLTDPPTDRSEDIPF